MTRNTHVAGPFAAILNGFAPTYDQTTDPVIARIRNAPSDADTFARIWRIASRKDHGGATDASNISTIEGIAERIERKTGDRLARVVIILCNTLRCPADQMDDIAAATAARVVLLQGAA